MIKHEMEAFRPKLLKLRQRFQGEVNTLADEAFQKTDGAAVGNLSNVPVDDRAELASESECEGATISLLENSNARLAEISAALERIDEGTFGRCEDCGHDLSNERLKDTPFARQCFECARNSEKGQPVSPGNL